MEILRDEGIRLIMLTGDNERTARPVAQPLGLDEVHAGVLPQDNRAIVQQLQQQGHIVAMADAGVNAPTLAQVAVGG